MASSSRKVGALLWAALVLAGIILMVVGLERSLLWISTPQLRQEARAGHMLIHVGAAVFIAAAIWSRFRRQPLLVPILIATPAVLIAGLVLAAPDSLFPHIGSLGLLPTAAGGLVVGTWYEWASPRRGSKP